MSNFSRTVREERQLEGKTGTPRVGGVSGHRRSLADRDGDFEHVCRLTVTSTTRSPSSFHTPSRFPRAIPEPRPAPAPGPALSPSLALWLVSRCPCVHCLQGSVTHHGVPETVHAASLCLLTCGPALSSFAGLPIHHQARMGSVQQGQLPTKPARTRARGVLTSTCPSSPAAPGSASLVAGQAALEDTAQLFSKVAARFYVPSSEAGDLALSWPFAHPPATGVVTGHCLVLGSCLSAQASSAFPCRLLTRTAPPTLRLPRTCSGDISVHASPHLLAGPGLASSVGLRGFSRLLYQPLSGRVINYPLSQLGARLCPGGTSLPRGHICTVETSTTPGGGDLPGKRPAGQEPRLGPVQSAQEDGAWPWPGDPGRSCPAGPCFDSVTKDVTHRRVTSSRPCSQCH